MGPSCSDQQYLFSFIIIYDWMGWNVSSDLSPQRISPNPGVKRVLLFVLNLTTVKIRLPLSVTWVQFENIILIFSTLFSSKNATSWEPSSIQLEAINIMVFTYGAPWVHLVLSLQAGCNGWRVSMREDWLLNSVFETTKSCLKLEISEESQQIA